MNSIIISTEYKKEQLPYYNTLTILDNYNKSGEVEKTLVTPLPLEELYDLENDPFKTKKCKKRTIKKLFTNRKTIKRRWRNLIHVKKRR